MGRGWVRSRTSLSWAGAQSKGQEARKWTKRAGPRAVRPFIPLLHPSPLLARGAPPVLLLISGTPASASLPLLLLLCLGFLSSVLVLEKFHLLLAQRGLEVPVLGCRKGEGNGSDPRLCWLTSPFPSDGSESSSRRSSDLLWGPRVPARALVSLTHHQILWATVRGKRPPPCPEAPGPPPAIPGVSGCGCPAGPAHESFPSELLGEQTEGSKVHYGPGGWASEG